MKEKGQSIKSTVAISTYICDIRIGLSGNPAFIRIKLVTNVYYALFKPSS
jgi:hypothetical protein